ncbi:hypothetical protein MMC07_002673 [Pseudocyphellaria aurata]|nr:hypothetical protein [Pseudocyphellaria aurata]
MADPQQSVSLNDVSDINRSFRDIFPSQETMRQQIVEIAKYSSRRSSARDWVSKMRFLTMRQSEDEKISYHQSSIVEGVVAPATFPASLLPATSPSGAVLELTDGSILADPAAYIAVSYCWNRENVEWFTGDIETPIEILQKDIGKRPRHVNPDVLHRSLAYAKHRGVNAIWIDQECINQDDPTDKENGIQAMDIVYQESHHPIAILEFFFQTQIEVDVFTSLVDFDFEPDHIEVLGDMLSLLSQDAWFSRAWTLQESTSAGPSMMLLLGCPGLNKHSDFGPTPGEFEISIWDFQNAMVNARLLIEEALAAEMWSDDSHAVYASNLADVLYNHIPTIYPNSFDGRRDASHRQQCNAAEALTFLDDRFNSVFSDRLAILANICNYEVRINSAVLELRGFSFSACALTLAILNGDMSLLAACQAYEEEASVLAGCQAYEEEASKKPGESNWVLDQANNGRSARMPFYKNDDADSSANAYGFSWGPKPSGSLRNILYLEECGDLFRLKPATISNHGLKVCGILWEIKHSIKAPKTQVRFASRWQEEFDLQAAEGMLDILTEETQKWLSWREKEGRQKSEDQDRRQQALLRDFSWSLVHEFVDSGHTDLAKTFWSYVQPLGRSEDGWTSKTAPRPYSFETVFGSPNPGFESNSSQDYNENKIKSGLHTTSFTSNIEGHPTILRQIMKQIVEGGALICGIPVKYSGYLEPRVWFESCQADDRVFTPFTQMADKVMLGSHRSEAVSWRVLQTGKVDGDCEVLHCLGRRRGIYRFEGLEPQVYTLD